MLSKNVSASESFMCENFQRQSCKAFTGLSDRTHMLVGEVPFYLKFSASVTHPLQKRRLPIDIRLYMLEP